VYITVVHCAKKQVSKLCTGYNQITSKRFTFPVSNSASQYRTGHYLD